MKTLCQIAGTLPLATAAFAASVLPGQALGPSAAEITACLDRARPALHKHLRQNRGNVLALLCLAALHDDLPIDAKVFRPALKRLDKTVLRGTYGAALRLLVMAENPLCFGKLTAENFEKKVRRDAKRILANRFRGGFTYAKRNSYWDLSNTQYAALGLRAASSLGFAVKPEIWENMLRTILAVQTETGGFGYTKNHRRKNAYASMTVAGIAVLQICKQHLPEKFWRALEVDSALDRAWAWMAREKLRIGSSRTLSCFYFHYGLERAAVLSSKKRVADFDWYTVGAGMLIEMQHPKKGSWRSDWEIRPGGLKPPGSPVDTAFAVLFLRRRFQQTLPQRYPRLFTLGTQATHGEITAISDALVRRGPVILGAVIRALRSPNPAKRQVAARALTKLAGKDFGYDPGLTPARSTDAIKAVERWWLAHPSRR